VLIADAAPEDCAALDDALSRDPAARYVVIEAESGLSALELRRTRRPDCLVIGHDLPDLSGLDVLKKLAAEERSPACAVVVLIGLVSISELRKPAMCCGSQGDLKSL